jgi:RNA polymerase sigma-70 factor (ECF subfamily)
LACEEFFRIVRPILNRIASRVARQYDAVSEIDDLVQEISMKLMASGRVILASLPREPPATVAYFSVLAANSARDFFRARNAAKRGRRATVSLDAPLVVFAARCGLPNSLDHDLLVSQIEDCLPDDRREQIVFRLYYRQGWTAKEIAAIPALDLTVKGVESMIFRTMKQIRQRLNLVSGIEVDRGSTKASSS